VSCQPWPSLRRGSARGGKRAWAPSPPGAGVSYRIEAHARDGGHAVTNPYVNPYVFDVASWRPLARVNAWETTARGVALRLSDGEGDDAGGLPAGGDVVRLADGGGGHGAARGDGGHTPGHIPVYVHAGARAPLRHAVEGGAERLVIWWADAARLLARYLAAWGERPNYDCREEFPDRIAVSTPAALFLRPRRQRRRLLV